MAHLPVGMSIRQTVVTLTAATSTILVAANPVRKYLAIINIGLGLASLSFDQAAVAGQGWPLSASSALGDAGGGITWEATGVTTQGVRAISTAGTTVVVMEGI